MSLASKRAELESVKARGQAIVEQYTDTAIPAETKTELAKLRARGYELAAIETHRIRADAGWKRDLIQKLGIEARDLH